MTKHNVSSLVTNPGGPERHKYWYKNSLLSIIQRLGVSTNLVLCLDAGDSSSYTSGQSWLDRSGNGYDFFLGADGSATATDPTFTGSAGGLTSGEYFALDGGDYFKYDSANETWMTNIHKDNALFTLLTWFYPGGSGLSTIMGTSGNNLAHTGIFWSLNNSNGNSLVAVTNGSGVASISNNLNFPNAIGNRWGMHALSIDEASSVGIRFYNGDNRVITSTYTTPSAGAATATFQIGAVVDTGFALSGSRFGAVAAWSRALTLGEISMIYEATRRRFGV